jgi:hypothetical protein
VQLNGPAPAGGAVVTLTSSDPAVAAMLSTVTVAAGATSARFGIKTATVTTSTAVTITASYAGVNRSETLTVSP